MNPKTVELHLIQSFPPSCVNRDGTNAPKDCTFGDYRRARISSQCLKRSIRTAEIFGESLDEAIAFRSKQVRDKKLIPHLLGLGKSQEQAETIADEFRVLLAKNDKTPALMSVGLYIDDAELFTLLEAFVAGNKKLGSVPTKKSADVALFGRMLAEAADLNVDAACQVAHAISTHRLAADWDFWTAADDLKDRENEDAGAGMLGNAEFNASVFYRYACLNLPQLNHNLGNDRERVTKTVEAFLLASYDAIPTGKLNGHAHFTPPAYALAVVRRKGMPLNLCNAFLKPIRAHEDKSLLDLSAEALATHLQKSRTMAPVDDADYATAHQLEISPNANVTEFAGCKPLVGWVMEKLG